jgi:hypothetical protein
MTWKCRSLMVPLDGSPLAEQALPWAVHIARQAGACLDLVLVHVLYTVGDPHAAWRLLVVRAHHEPVGLTRDVVFRHVLLPLDGSLFADPRPPCPGRAPANLRTAVA